jgi:hypothetical protein
MRRIILLSLLIMLLGSCSDRKGPTKFYTDGPKELTPLAVGNIWYGRVIGPSEISPDVVDTSQLLQQVTRDTIINGETWYRLITGEIEPRNVGVWLTNRRDGVYHLENSYSGLVAYLEAKYPSQAGDQYTRGEYAVITVQATEFPVTVGNRRYTTDVHVLHLPSDSIVIYYAPGLGLVKSEVYLNGATEPDRVFLLDSAQLY